jgi:hypothetical protein
MANSEFVDVGSEYEPETLAETGTPTQTGFWLGLPPCKFSEGLLGSLARSNSGNENRAIRIAAFIILMLSLLQKATQKLCWHNFVGFIFIVQFQFLFLGLDFFEKFGEKKCRRI